MLKINLLCVLLLASSLLLNAHGKNGNGLFVRPLYDEMPLGAVRPEGWLKHQLEIMRDGSTGHLDETHDKLKNSNGWLGGTGDAWEETPYWLDGAVPLAYQLNDPSLQEKVLKYINWTLDNQRPSGYFGGITKYEREHNCQVTEENISMAGDDWWPKMVMLKVLKQYYQATGDKRVLPFMTRYFRFQMNTLKQCPLGRWTEWAQSRGADNVMIVQWLYQQTGEKWLLGLAQLVESQSFQWSDWFGGRDWVISPVMKIYMAIAQHRALNYARLLKRCIRLRRLHQLPETRFTWMPWSA